MLHYNKSQCGYCNVWIYNRFQHEQTQKHTRQLKIAQAKRDELKKNEPDASKCIISGVDISVLCVHGESEDMA